MREELLLLQFRDLKLTRVKLFQHLQQSPFFRNFVYNKDGVENRIYESIQDNMFNISISMGNIKELLLAFQKKRICAQERIEWCDFVRFSSVFCYPEELEQQELVANLIDEIQNSEGESEELLSRKAEKWLLQ